MAGSSVRNVVGSPLIVPRSQPRFRQQNHVLDTRYQVIEERHADGGRVARYSYGDDIDRMLTMERGGAKYVYHYDAQGSVTEITDGSGMLVERYMYDIYGSPTIVGNNGDISAASAINNSYLYTGREFDPESGNYYFRARMYSPSIGRFLQMDPIGFLDGLNLYASHFVVNARDPSGRIAVEIGFTLLVTQCYRLFDLCHGKGLCGCPRCCSTTLNLCQAAVLADAVELGLECLALPPPFDLVCAAAVAAKTTYEIGHLLEKKNECLYDCGKNANKCKNDCH